MAFIEKTKNEKVDWLAVSFNIHSTKCLRSAVFLRTHRWTKLSLGEFACSACTNMQKICFRDLNGRLEALPPPAPLCRGGQNCYERWLLEWANEAHDPESISSIFPWAERNKRSDSNAYPLVYDLGRWTPSAKLTDPVSFSPLSSRFPGEGLGIASASSVEDGFSVHDWDPQGNRKATWSCGPVPTDESNNILP